MPQFITWNSVTPTTAARTYVTTGTAIKTMLQLGTPSIAGLKVVRWGVRFETAPTATVRCELIETTNVAATVTAHVAAGIAPYTDASAGLASVLVAGVSTTTTGYTASGEGSVTGSTRVADEIQIPIGISFYDYEWSQGREFQIAPSKILRVRMTTGTAVNAACYIVHDE